MTRASNQAIERGYFEQFRAHFPLPAGSVEYTDKPDVIIHGARKLGVEIANLYLSDGGDSSSEQAQRRFRKRVLQEAQAQYLAAGGRKIELTISFDPTHPITSPKALASALAAAAKPIERSPAGPVSRTLLAHMPEVCSIYYNPVEYPDAVWRASQCYTVPSLSLSRVAAVATAKHDKLRAYVPCNAFWLLLVVDFFDSAQDQGIQWPDPDSRFPSPFERIILYKPQFAEWAEVPIKQ
ncbi:MAG: hypothetical protein ACYCSR_05625 [Thiomonas sp.]|uniref:Uncharacterized protein n=1 Tax=mine drainage metagenome TaxID=410659 RepID=E6PL89_9ZZZZ